MRRFLTILFFIATLIAALRYGDGSSDPWQDFHPFWGERPGATSESGYTEINGSRLAFHQLRGAEDWVEAQCREFNCRRDEANEVDRLLLTGLGCSGTPRSIWRSPSRYDLEGTSHQAVQPTFIDRGEGVWLFYLYDWYNHVSPDAIPPRCEVLKRKYTP